ncbi:LPXTG cell wall anchor domain-containing protein [Heliobacterium mobile]|nr:LPXTG cell wall anchor domain-containing protein [Heliobacterium mobile]
MPWDAEIWRFGFFLVKETVSFLWTASLEILSLLAHQRGFWLILAGIVFMGAALYLWRRRFRREPSRFQTENAPRDA